MNHSLSQSETSLLRCLVGEKLISVGPYLNDVKDYTLYESTSYLNFEDFQVKIEFEFSEDVMGESFYTYELKRLSLHGRLMSIPYISPAINKLIRRINIYGRDIPESLYRFFPGAEVDRRTNDLFIFEFDDESKMALVFNSFIVNVDFLFTAEELADYMEDNIMDSEYFFVKSIE